MSRPLEYVFAAALLISGTTAALADQGAVSGAAAQKTADHDFGKLSIDGQDALHDIHKSRLEIFDGQTSSAKTDIAKALSSLNKAQSDEAVFKKAEWELKTPASMQGKTRKAGTPSTTQVEWLPVDGVMALDEDYVASPDKSAGVNKANEKLAKGDQKGAMDELKIAHVDVDFLMEVAPLKATLSGVQQASDELNAGKYYEANQALKSVEDGMRFDSETLVATPQNANSSSTKKSNG